MDGEQPKYVVTDPPCRADPYLFSDHEGETAAVKGERISAAKVICVQCPYQVDCYAGAVARREPQGVWGGVAFPEEARARLRAEARRLEQAGAVPVVLDEGADDRSRAM